MATRSAIVELTKEGVFRGIYCHNDGYPEYNGKMLVNYYNSQEKVSELISLGSISSLDREVKPLEGQEHSFDERASGVTVAYFRDRGEPLEYTQTIVGDTLREVAGKIDYAYLYLFKDGKWFLVQDEIENAKLVDDVLFELEN